jgi:RHS repeat-associated protein
MKPISGTNMKNLINHCLVPLGAALALAVATPGFSAPATSQTRLAPPAPTNLDGWSPPPLPTSHPKDFIHAAPAGSGGGSMQSMVYNPDPGETGTIAYTTSADDPLTDAALVNLAHNLGDDPIRIYEWVRNNVRTEFYFGGSRGAYLTFLEKAGNDIDQCALLGALFKVAGFIPTYRLEWIDVPRTASGPNHVGIYEWLGVDNDASALSVLSAYSPAVGSNNMFYLAQMWVSINIPVRGETKFVPSIKPHSVGRQPNLDSLSGYIWNDAAIAGVSGDTGDTSIAINSAAVGTYLAQRSVQASEAIRTSNTLHDLSGAELARLPMVVPEVVSITAPGATSYPDGLTFTPNAQAISLAGIPANYCSRLKVKVGTVETWFATPDLLGRSLTVEFDDGVGILLHNGNEVIRDTSGNSSGTVAIELTYTPASAFFSGTPPPYTGTHTVARQNTVAVIYSFGRTLGRLEKLLEEVTAKEAASVTNVSSTDRQMIIGQQYVSQLSELVSLATAYLGHDSRRQFVGGLVYLSGSNPVVDMRLNLVGLYPRSATAPFTPTVYRAASLLMGALEGTAIEQLSGSKAFGAPAIFDRAMVLGYGARYFKTLAAFNASAFPASITANISSAATSDIQAHLVAGGHVVLLDNNNVTYDGQSFGGYLRISPSFGGVATVVKGAKGGVTKGGVGDQPVAEQKAPDETKPATHVVTTTTDPVDLTNGAFLKNDVDLVVGVEGEPNGLRLERNYNSARRHSDPTGMGRGFTHNYAMRLTLRSPNDIDAQKASYDAVLPILVAIRHAEYSLGMEPEAARSWLHSCTSITWAVNQQLGSRASLTLGARSVEFVKRPDGTYRAPGNLTATLVKQIDGSHDLAFRHGNIIHFRASDGKFTSIKDLFNNTLNAGYESSTLKTVTDAYGRSFTFTYDGSSGRLTGVSDSTGRSVSYGRDGSTFEFFDAEGKKQRYEMDADYLMTKIVDARGRTVVENDYNVWKQVWRQRTFGEAGRTTQIKITPGIGTEIDPAGGAVRTYFDARGRKIFVVDQAGGLAEWRYDGVDRLVKAITPKGRLSIPIYSTSWGYDKNHVLISETNPGDATNLTGDTRTIEPDAQNRPWKVRNFEGKETVFEYWKHNGTVETAKIKQITAPGDIVSSFQYDTRGRLSEAHPAGYADGKFDVYTYDDLSAGFGNLKRITHPADANTDLDDQDYDDYLYNARGDLLEMIDRKDIKTSYQYNARRQPTVTTLGVGSAAVASYTYYDAAGDLDYTLDAANRKTDFEYDALGHLVQVKRGPIGSQVVVLGNSYADPRTLLTTSTDALGDAVTYTYNAAQQMATVTDPIDRTTSFGYNVDMQRTTIQTPLGFVTTRIFNSRGLLDGIDQPREDVNEPRMIDYTYDKDGRKTVLANRLNKEFGWSYNDAARTISSTTPTGKVTTAVASTRGLPASIKKPSDEPGSPSIVYDAYDAEGRLTQKTDGVGTTTYTYWPNGLLKTVAENGKTTTRTYDALNRLSQYKDGESNNGEDNVISYTYHASGELATLVYPGNKTVTYNYDDFGRLWKVTDWASRQTTYAYDEASRLKRIDRPNGTYRIQEYDDASQLRFIKEYKSDGTVITFQELRYDDDGRITYNFIYPKPDAITLLSDDLLYDYDNRLSTWNSQSVVFDPDGNMTNGPLPSGTIGAYSYDARNRLTSAGGLGYRYNPDGSRVEITGTGSATFVIDPNAALSRTLMRTKGGVTTYYIYGLGLLYEETGGVTKTYHADQVGSTLAMTDTSGGFTDRWTYTPYGALVSHTGPTDTPFQFNGELGVQTDANGLLHMRARYYNPRLMRFVNADPIGFGGGLNWYAFAGNDPISRFDPFGLKDGRKTSVTYGPLEVLDDNYQAPNSTPASTTNNSRSVDVYVWNRDLPSVGHAMVTDHNSTLVVVSQFPMNKDGNEGTYRPGQGFNQTLTYQQTFDAEGRQPSTVYVVQLNNYTGALNQAATEQGREFWNWDPTQPNQTQCTTATFNVLVAGGTNLQFTNYNSGTIMPNTLNQWLDQLSKQPGSGVTKDPTH